jgi:endonuclease/exonuclease/phosphatase family metal-dependent hydrolase
MRRFALPLVFGCGSLAEGKPAIQPQLASPCGSVVVASYNLNFGLSGDPETLAAALATDADVLVLQEVTEDWVAAFDPVEDWTHRIWHPDPAAGGIAVLSRFPLREQELLPSPVGWFPALSVRVATPLGELTVLGLHLMPPVAPVGSFVVGALTTDDERLRELDAYMSVLDPSTPTVVVGDFNERDGDAVGLLLDQGYRPAVPPEDTWRWPVGPITLRGQLDHIFVGPGLVAGGGQVLQQGRSDHLPLVATVWASADGGGCLG